MRRPFPFRFPTAFALALTLGIALAEAPASAQDATGTGEPPDTGEARYTVEVAARRSLEWAKHEADRIARELGSEVAVRVDYRAPSYVIRVGDFVTSEEAEPVLERLQELGYKEASITPVTPLEAPPDLEVPGAQSDIQPPREPVAPVPVAPVEEEAPAEAEAPLLEPSAAPAARKQIRATRIENGSLTIDGMLEEPLWDSASFVSDFQQKGAKGGFPIHHATQVAVVYDDEAIYIGGRMSLPNGSVRARRSQRDDGADADRLIVSLDTYRNRQSAYNFGVTAGGTRIDYYQPRDIFQVREYTFDPVWKASADVNGSGWTAEMRIPLSSLRFHTKGDPPIWGINIQRVSPALRLYAFWVVVPGEETGWASRFGDLVGLEDVRPHKRLAVVPYVAAQETTSDLESSTDPFSSDEQDLRFGGDLLMDLTSSLALEATFNPDFGQIEADPSVINLSAFEVFFPEKRPFFIEGAELFEGRGPQYFYSRRIGAPPHGRVNAPFSDIPAETTISGAAKLIGRWPGGWSSGTLLALTDEEDATTFDPETRLFGNTLVEPRTLFGVSRLQTDLGAGSTFGVIGTGVARDFSIDDTLETLLPEQAFAGGADWNVRFAGQSHELGGFVGASRVEGDPAAILRLQRSSARYLQRPDADYVELDPRRTSLEGYAAGLQLGRIKGAWQWTLSGEARSPGFELNDAGAMATADDVNAFGQLSYHAASPGGPFRRVDISTSLASGWNFGGVRQYTTPEVDTRLVWRNFWQTFVRVAHDTSASSDSLTRGGPLMETPAGWRSYVDVSTNDARQWVWSLGGWSSTNDLDSWGYGANMRAQVRFADRFTFSIAPGYDRTRNTRQFYTTLAGNRIETFNQRYVFATLDQETAYTRLRMGLAITPRFGIDLYLEPFASIGTYEDFGELAAAGTSDLRVYGTEGTTITRLPDGSYEVTDGEATFSLADGDFDVTSLRGNLVLRWDYARGSTFFFAWAQTRDASDVLGEQIEPGDLVDVLDLPERNVLTAKISFRLDLL